MSFVDVAVAAVPTANKDDYLTHSRSAGEVFRENGALRYLECWGSDISDGDVTSFIKAVQCGADETVSVSIAVWPDKETRNAAMPKIMSDPRMAMDQMPFDGKRLIFGGFDALIDI